LVAIFDSYARDGISKMVKAVEQALEWVLSYQVGGSSNHKQMQMRSATSGGDHEVKAEPSSMNENNRGVVRTALCPTCLTKGHHVLLNIKESSSPHHDHWTCDSSIPPHTGSMFDIQVNPVDYPQLIMEEARTICSWTANQVRDYLLSGSSLHEKVLVAFRDRHRYAMHGRDVVALTDDALRVCSVLPGHRAEVLRAVHQLKGDYAAYAVARLEAFTSSISGMPTTPATTATATASIAELEEMVGCLKLMNQPALLHEAEKQLQAVQGDQVASLRLELQTVDAKATTADTKASLAQAQVQQVQVRVDEQYDRLTRKLGRTTQ
jgi:hypothetical protein